MERAAELSVDPVEIYMTLGQLHLILNHPESALIAFRKAEDTTRLEFWRRTTQGSRTGF